MHKGDMGIPRCASIDSQTERMIFRDTKVIRTSFIHEGEGAGRSSVPGMRWNHIESGLQLCFGRRGGFDTLAVLDVDTRSKPFHDVSVFVMERRLPVPKRPSVSVCTSPPRF